VAEDTDKVIHMLFRAVNIDVFRNVISFLF